METRVSALTKASGVGQDGRPAHSDTISEIMSEHRRIRRKAALAAKHRVSRSEAMDLVESFRLHERHEKVKIMSMAMSGVMIPEEVVSTGKVVDEISRRIEEADTPSMDDVRSLSFAIRTHMDAEEAWFGRVFG